MLSLSIWANEEPDRGDLGDHRHTHHDPAVPFQRVSLVGWAVAGILLVHVYTYLRIKEV